ncbi:2'-5' RNA ligase family protein [Nonomuraea lactucae]|uniref:2'-5' RNA ligase family protein n=1 Tax=Nonomuraea lactucae TaxID=2249762 RepID=UPI00196586D7|nr:2'-5' RNA ligase family protein [Nonomuraea lactucae]
MGDDHRMADHWWWRPGWEQGRRFYTWHLTFEDAPEVHRLAQAYRDGLADVPGLDLVPDQWLHLTTQGLGFVGEVDEADMHAIVQAATKRLAGIAPFELTLDRPRITPEAIRWEAAPAEPPSAVRDAIRAAIGDVWATVPEPADGFAAHVTIAYSNAGGPAGPALAALDAVEAAPAVAPVRSAELIVLGRDRRMYEWDSFATVPLGA